MAALCCPAVILAAGEGRRVGGPKALLDVSGSTALERVLRGCQAGAFSPLIAVVPPALRSEVAGICPEIEEILVNSAPATGPLGSLHIALEALPDNAAGLLMCMVDFCLVRDATYAALGSAVHRDPTRLWRPVHGERHGHPVWFPASLFGSLRTAPMDQGARVVVYSNRDLWGAVSVEDAWIHRDLDTPADLEEFRRSSAPRS